MALQTYRLVGAQDPANRIDRWEVESPSDEFPDGKVLIKDGEPVELTDRQYEIGSRFLRLEPVPQEEVADVQIVDQPGIERESLSTDNPPDLGTAPDVSTMNKAQLVTELNRVRGQDPTALEGVTENTNRDDLRSALQEYHGQSQEG